MTFIELIRLLLSNLKIIFLVPIVMAVVVHQKTKNMPNSYESNTMVYTGIASGFNIESSMSSRIDKYSVNTQFDNLINTIKSKNTLQEVGLRLLATHLLLDEPDPDFIGRPAFIALKQSVSEKDRKKLVVQGNFDLTFKKLQKAFETGKPAIVQKRINGGPYYSSGALSSVSAKRLNSSDMVKLSFQSDDAAVCRLSLEILLEVFIRRYREIKVSETNDVVEYFQEELRKSKAFLDDSEARMKQFREDGRILNYYEQTKAIAVKKEAIADEYKKALGSVKASKAILEELEFKLGIDHKFFLKNEEVLRRKDNLAEVSSQIALMEIGEDSTRNLENLRRKARILRSELKQDLVDLYTFTHSTEGVPVQQLLEQWLGNLIGQEVNKGLANALQERLDEIDQLYDEFAPLGSGLKKLEREIGLRERSYIQILHDLNMALIRQQNIQLSAQIDVVDKPDLKSLGNKRMLLVIVSFIVGFILTIAAVITIEMLDTTLKTPEKASRTTKLELIGAFPLLIKKHRRVNAVAEKECVDRTLSNLKVALSQVPDQPLRICMFSIQGREGVTMILDKLSQNLRAIGLKVLCVQAIRQGKKNQGHEDDYFYRTDNRMLAMKSVPQLIGRKIDESAYDYIFLGIPSILKGHIPTDLVHQCHLNMMVLRATRSWYEADRNALDTFCQLTEQKPYLLANGVRPDRLTPMIGEVKVKKRFQKLRKLVKRILKFEFKSKEF